MKGNNKKIIIIIAVILIAIIGTAVFFIFNNNNKGIELTEINDSEIKYYRIIKNEKVGVINKDGETIIEPQYANIRIPNPTTEVFICTDQVNSNDEKWKAVNAQNQPAFEQYEEVEAIPINQISSNIPYEKSVLKFKKNNLYGLIDFNGKQILPAEYEEITNIEYKEGYLKVKKEGLYGVVSIDGKTIIKPNYYNITSDRFYNEKTKYSKAGFILQIKSDSGYKYGYADTNGKQLLETLYNDITRINEIEDEKDTYLFTTTNGKYGLTKNEKIQLENEFDGIEYDKTTNLLVVAKSNKYGVYTLEGQQLIPIEYQALSIGGDYINVYNENERKAVYDKNGKQIDTQFYSHLEVTNNNSIVIDQNNNYNITDSSNNLLLQDKFIYIEHYKDNLFIATKGATSGIINTNGNEVVPFKYSTIQKITGTDLLEATANNRTDIINENGQVVEGIEKGVIEKSDNYIKMYSDNDVKYFDFNGNEKTYQDFVTNNKIYAKKQNGRWGFTDANGNKVIDFVYDMVTEQNGNFAGVKKDGKWGVIDADGKVIVNPIYKLSWNNVKFLSTYYKLNNRSGEAIYCADVIE